MNKFDDMMVFLTHRVPEFKQVVAVDCDFTIFSRAWCVAELVQASAEQIPQRVQVFSRRHFDIRAEDAETYLKLATLSVARCEASRPEDKEAILARIPNVAEFDMNLQSIIFGEQGVLQQVFVGLDMLDAAVRTARRMKVLADDAERMLRAESQQHLVETDSS